MRARALVQTKLDPHAVRELRREREPSFEPNLTRIPSGSQRQERKLSLEHNLTRLQCGSQDESASPRVNPTWLTRTQCGSQDESASPRLTQT